MASSILPRSHRKVPSVVAEVARWMLFLAAIAGLLLTTGPLTIR
jgi:hypothetical protein